MWYVFVLRGLQWLIGQQLRETLSPPPSLPEPVLVSELILETTTLSGVLLDWSRTFRLDGVLVHYDLTRNGILLTRNTATSVSLLREPNGMSESLSLFLLQGEGEVISRGCGLLKGGIADRKC